jgi:hypothetical protein
MRELRNAFVRRKNSPDVRRMMASYEAVISLLPEIGRQTGTRSLFEASVFEALVSATVLLRDR